MVLSRYLLPFSLQVYNRWFRKNDETWWHRERRKSIPLHHNDDQPTTHSTETDSGGSKPLLQPKHISSDNDSTRQEHNHLPHGAVNVISPQQGKHNQATTGNGHPTEMETDAATTTTSSRSSSSAAPTVTMISNDYHRRYQSEHISKHFCENNELQSNSNLLLNQQQPHQQNRASRSGFQEPNIIKHTEL